MSNSNTTFATSFRHAGVMTCIAFCLAGARTAQAQAIPDGPALKIGWASGDLTPDRPVMITGQHYARVSEGVMDPITVTALALEAGASAGVVLVSCDLITIPDELRGGNFRARIRERVLELLPAGQQPAIVLNATHTHAAPEIRLRTGDEDGTEVRWGVELDIQPPPEYVAFAAQRIAETVVRAWTTRQPGGISFGLSHAVVGHNRIMSYEGGKSQMYGSTGKRDFRHVEGWEDHTVNLLYTWDRDRRLTGVLVNLPSPPQHDQHSYLISADFWHDIRVELRTRLGDGLFILPQCSAAGDQSERVMIHRRAEQRMEKMTVQNRRQRVAGRVADAVEGILPVMREHIEWNPVMACRFLTLDLPRHAADRETYDNSLKTLPENQAKYQRLREALAAHPEQRDKPRWYADITRAYDRMRRDADVIRRYETPRGEATAAVEIFVLRLGDLAMATNPFELYLDFGIQIQERSKAVQTFIVQLAGGGSYLAPERAVAGGAYGATPSQNMVTSAGGRMLVEQTLVAIDALFHHDVDFEFKLNMTAVGDLRLPPDQWRFRTDPEGTGRTGQWFAPDLDDSAWRADVPAEASWQSNLETPYYGDAWYRQTVDLSGLPPGWERAFLQFEGVDEQAWVWMNGHFVGEHVMGPAGWNVAFLLEITDALVPGAANQVTVLVANTVHGGGIWRPVRLRLFR